MALPVPTKTTICTNALKLAGIPNPAADELSLAEDTWFNYVLKEIARKKNCDELQDTKIAILDAFKQRVPVPTDFEDMLEITFYDGTHKGTATAGSASNITLQADEDITESEAKGKQIFLTGGTGKGGMGRILTYSETTLIAGVSPSWGTNPGSSSTYMIADFERDLSYIAHEKISIVTSTGTVVDVTYYDGELYMDPIPDLGTYAIVMRFVTDITQIDTSSSRYSDLLAKWEQALVQGVVKYALKYMGDIVAARDATNEFNRELVQLIRRDNRKRWQRHRSYAGNLGGMPIE